MGLLQVRIVTGIVGLCDEEHMHHMHANEQENAHILTPICSVFDEHVFCPNIGIDIINECTRTRQRFLTIWDMSRLMGG